MPLLSYEGVEVDIPTALAGIKFSFVGSTLTIQCHNFTGDIVLSKNGNASTDTNPSMNLLSAFSSTLQCTPSSATNEAENDVKFSMKRKETSDQELDVEAELLRKRVRPNFLNDVEQSMLLAQLEASQQSQQHQRPSQPAHTLFEEDEDDDNDSIVASSAPEKENVVPESSQPEREPPIQTQVSPASQSIAKEKSAVNIKKQLFSPEAPKIDRKPKRSTPKKSPSFKQTTPESGKKSTRARSKAQESTQLSIRDMMMPAVTGVGRTIRYEEMMVTGATSPSERWGHSVTKIADNKVVVYGGANDDEVTLGDLFVLDLTKNEWTRPLNCESIPRAWHDAVYLESKHLLLVFGGERAIVNDSDGPQIDVLSDIMVLDTDCFLWYPPAISGTPPTARSGHTCTVVGNDVVVFGGSRGRSRQSTVHVLDSEKWHWKSVKVDGKPPSARTYHSAVAVGDSIVVFGGNDNKKSFNSVHVLKKQDDDDNAAWSWFHPCVVGLAPTARTGHSATLVAPAKILIYGGWDPQQQDKTNAKATSNVFQDAFLLDTESWEWEQVTIQPEDDPLAGRVGHRGIADANGSVYLFGGQDANEQRLHVIHALHFDTKGTN